MASIDTVPSPEPHSHQILPRQLQKVSGYFVLAGDEIFRLRARLACGLFIAWSVNEYILELPGDTISREVPGLVALDALMLA